MQSSATNLIDFKRRSKEVEETNYSRTYSRIGNTTLKYANRVSNI